ncbi:hypothetical protein SVAN01_06111 [Stagonosporopsis vannaccii]|nr:hypothetical protein SVAN01_06111 [Stagonosporopsis vannaccii]
MSPAVSLCASKPAAWSFVRDARVWVVVSKAVSTGMTPAAIPGTPSSLQGSMTAAGSRLRRPRSILCERAGLSTPRLLSVGAARVRFIRNLQNGPIQEHKHSLASHSWRAHWPRPRSQDPKQRIPAAQA